MRQTHGGAMLVFEFLSPDQLFVIRVLVRTRY